LPLMAYSLSGADGSISRVVVQRSDAPTPAAPTTSGLTKLASLARLSFTMVVTFLCLATLLMTVRSRIPVNPRGYPLKPYSYFVEPAEHEQERDPDHQIER
jgi:hypothetical protein